MISRRNVLVLCSILSTFIMINKSFSENVANETSGIQFNVEDDQTLNDLQEVEKFKLDIQNNFFNGKLEDLENLCVTLRKDRVFSSSGDDKLDLFYIAINDLYKNKNATEKLKFIEKLKDWNKAFPNHLAPKVAIIEAYKDLAWDYRGAGFASTVSEASFGQFSENLVNAENIINEVISSNQYDPRVYSLWITVGNGLDYDKERLYDILKLSIEKDSKYYQIYSRLATPLLPRWQGDRGEDEAFARSSAESNTVWGEMLYAIIAVKVQSYELEEILSVHNFDYQRLKNSFEKLLNVFPNSFNFINQYAWFACHYKDPLQAKKLFDQIGERWDSIAEKIWESKNTYNYWKKWADQASLGIAPEKNIYQAIKEHDYATIKEWFKNGADPNVKDEYGNPLLFSALRGKDHILATILITAGVNIDNPKDSESALHWAVIYGSIDVIDSLLERKVDVNIANYDGNTPLHYACHNGFYFIVKRFLAVPNVDVNFQTNQGFTPLADAASRGQTEVVKLLLDHPNIKVDSEDIWFQTPLTLASQLGYLEVVKLLVEKDADINHKGFMYKTPLDVAQDGKKQEVVDYLKSIGAKNSDPSIYEEANKHLIELGKVGLDALHQKNFEVARKIFQEAYDLRIPDPGITYNMYLLAFNLDKDYEKAYKLLLKSIILNPKMAFWRYQMAELLKFMKQDQKANYYFNSAYKLSPTDPGYEMVTKEFPEFKDLNK